MLRRTPHFQKHQPACKPGSVGHRLLAQAIRDGHSSGTMFAHCLEQPTRTASLTLPSRRFRFSANSPRCRPYSVLLPVWFAMPPPLPEARCALTAPFHPYSPSQLTLPWRSKPRGPVAPKPRRGEGERFVLCGTFPGTRCPLARTTPRRMLSGTVCRWSPDFPLPQPFDRSRSGRPAD